MAFISALKHIIKPWKTHYTKNFIQAKEWKFPPSQKPKLAVESSWQGIRNSSNFLCWSEGRGFVPLSLSLSVLAHKKLHQVIFQMAETPLTGKGNAILLREVYIFPLVLISSHSTYIHIVLLELNFLFLLLAHFYFTQQLFRRFLQFQDKFALCRNNDSKYHDRSSLNCLFD